MSITDELREYVNQKPVPTGSRSLMEVRDKYNAIADRIDAAHEREVREQYDKGLNDGYDVGFASADDWDDDHADALHKHGWVMAPRDADGKVIHIDDKLVCDYTYGETITVLGFGVQNCHDADKGVFAYNGDDCCWFNADCLHHVERPTVEGTLRELVAHVTPDVEWEDELFAEYADRIREVLRDE